MVKIDQQNEKYICDKLFNTMNKLSAYLKEKFMSNTLYTKWRNKFIWLTNLVNKTNKLFS